MKFLFTPEEARRTAANVARYFSKYMKVRVEKPYSEQAPYRTTLLGEIGIFRTLVECQGSVDYHRELKDLRSWLFAQRAYAELYIAAPEQAGLLAGALQDIKDDGVGLILVTDDDAVSILQRPKNPALIVNPDPTLRYGACKQEVIKSLEKFNEVNRKDGLRDMCELVERETESLALIGARKKMLKMAEKDVQAMDWSNQINTLASANAHMPGIAPMIGPELKDDLRSFTRGRNLVDHKVHGKRAEQNRQKQFAERMVQGPRLVADLVALKRKFG